ncbi:MAG: thioether cross-link-forming SCIFF peptide maturase [Tissierellia bacterium]|nr:thioether cross-link-forming SCIFF peptide maturase [Tissierellia bacterium]
MRTIHRFHLNDQYMLLDVASGSVHVVAPVAYDLAEDLMELDREALVAKFQDRYDPEEIREAHEELMYLVEEGYLYTEDEPVNLDDFNPDFLIKAMCLHVAHDCNLRCKYCFAAQGDFHGERLLMDLETGKRALDFLLQNSGSRHNLEVDFFGGEPLMNFDLVKELVDYGRREEKKYGKHFRFTMTTNGILLNEEVSDYLNEEMDNVVLSLDGRKEVNDAMRPTANGKGSFDTIIPKFKYLVDHRGDKDYYIRGTFTSNNLDFSQDVALYRDLGFQKTSMEPVVTDPREPYAIREEHLETILQEYEKLSQMYMEWHRDDPDFKFFHFMVDLSQGPCAYKKSIGCGAGTEYIAVTPEGDIYPCHQFVGEEDFILGNVREGIENRSLQESFYHATVEHKEACQQCWAKYYCSGGCHANAYHNNGTILEPFSIGCAMEQHRLECALSVAAAEAQEA